MSAERLREAAALMRERADAALAAQGGDPRPWFAHQPGTDEMYEWGWVGCYSAPEREFPGLFVAETPHTNDGIAIAEHIASWHPAVALAVARMLDEAAAALEHADLCLDCFHPTCLTVGEAIGVANAYLGGQP